MAIHANSIPAPARPLLPGELASFGLLPLAEQHPQLGFQHDRALLAILDAGPISPSDLVFMSAQRRKRALLSIDALIDMLDAIDPDPDLEPSFGFLPHGAVADDCEPDVDDEDGGDQEPSLGSIGSNWSALPQTMWSVGDKADREEQCEDEGACVQSQPHDQEPDEPSLGSLDRALDQEGWAGEGVYACSDRERGDDNGIADEDGRAEQCPQHSLNLQWSNGGYIA